jgi:hypothetical protein
MLLNSYDGTEDAKNMFKQLAKKMNEAAKLRP